MLMVAIVWPRCAVVGCAARRASAVLIVWTAAVKDTRPAGVETLGKTNLCWEKAANWKCYPVNLRCEELGAEHQFRRSGLVDPKCAQRAGVV
jgi:hypothetical protein